MKRPYATHPMTPRNRPQNRRDVWLLPLSMLVALGAMACSSDESGGADGDSAVLTRLTTGAAGDLLSSGSTPSEPEAPGLQALARSAPTGPTPAQETVDSLGVDFGALDAPVRIIEFYDFGCGYCRGFHQDTRGPLHERYVDQGQVFWKSMPFILGRWPGSVPMSLAAECARDQGRDYFEAISTLIFRRQSDWKAASEPGEVAEELATEVGLDMPRYLTCVESDQLLWKLQAQTAFAQRLGVRATPTFFLVGWGLIPGALPLETFEQVFDTVLAQVAAEQF